MTTDHDAATNGRSTGPVDIPLGFSTSPPADVAVARSRCEPCAECSCANVA